MVANNTSLNHQVEKSLFFLSFVVSIQANRLTALANRRLSILFQEGRIACQCCCINTTWTYWTTAELEGGSLKPNTHLDTNCIRWQSCELEPNTSSEQNVILIQQILSAWCLIDSFDMFMLRCLSWNDSRNEDEDEDEDDSLKRVVVADRECVLVKT